MLNIVSSVPQTFTNPGDLTFDINKVETNCYTLHVPGSAEIILKRAGYYLVMFNSTATAAASSETAPIEVQLYKNNVADPYAVTTTLSDDNGADMNISMTTVVKVPYSCPIADNQTRIKFRSIGAGAKFEDTSVTVVYVK